MTALAWRIRTSGAPDASRVIGQWELYDIPADYTGRDALEELLAYMDAKGLDRIKAATQIMIAPLGYEFRIVRNIITNFHQPHRQVILQPHRYGIGQIHRGVPDVLANGLDNGSDEQGGKEPQSHSPQRINPIPLC